MLLTQSIRWCRQSRHEHFALRAQWCAVLQRNTAAFGKNHALSCGGVLRRRYESRTIAKRQTQRDAEAMSSSYLQTGQRAHAVARVPEVHQVQQVDLRSQRAYEDIDSAWPLTRI